MSVSNPIIAAKSRTRKNTRMVVGKITSVEPPETRVFVKDGVLQSEEQLPEIEGQMLFYRPPNSGQTVIMFVVVDYDGEGTLRWAPVVPNTVPIDFRSGKPKDPLYDFYGLHAS